MTVDPRLTEYVLATVQLRRTHADPVSSMLYPSTCSAHAKADLRSGIDGPLSILRPGEDFRQFPEYKSAMMGIANAEVAEFFAAKCATGQCANVDMSERSAAFRKKLNVKYVMPAIESMARTVLSISPDAISSIMDIGTRPIMNEDCVTCADTALSTDTASVNIDPESHQVSRKKGAIRTDTTPSTDTASVNIDSKSHRVPHKKCATRADTTPSPNVASTQSPNVASAPVNSKMHEPPNKNGVVRTILPNVSADEADALINCAIAINNKLRRVLHQNGATCTILTSSTPSTNVRVVNGSRFAVNIAQQGRSANPICVEIDVADPFKPQVSLRDGHRR